MALRDPIILEHTLQADQHAALLELARRLHERYGAVLERLVVFGSRARGDASEESDIDLLATLRCDASRMLHEERAIWRVAEAVMSERRVFLPLSLVILPAGQFAELLARERRFALDVTKEGIAL
jgi:uncharacterized protein